MKNFSETHGSDLIKRVAKEKATNKNLLSRVWSDEFQSWGFFCDQPNEGDIFMIMGCSSPGDILRTSKHWPYMFTTGDYKLLDKDENINEVYIILRLNQFILEGVSMYGLEVLSSDPPKVYQIISQQATLFKIAWEYVGKNNKADHLR